MKRKFVLGVILTSVFLVMSFGVWRLLPRQTGEENPERSSAVTSFYPLYFLANEISGGKIEVTNVTPAGSEPHDYEPTARDIALIQESKLLFLNGNGFEAWGEKIKEEVAGIKVIEVGQGLFTDNDPHIWLSPGLIRKMAKIVAEEIIKTDPDNKKFYTERAVLLDSGLQKLQVEYASGLSGCRTKDFVTSHDAFAYLAREFGLTQIAIAGMSPDEEPSTQDLVKVVKLAQEKDLKYIFFERLISPKLSETIAEEIGAKTLVLDPVEGISDNDLAQGKNYLTVMRENLTNLRVALECQ